jgi:hypothetical protein
MSLWSKQHEVIEFLTAENVSLVDIYWRIKVIYGDNCVDVSTFQHRAAMQVLGMSA